MKEINLSVNLAGRSSRAVNALVRRLNALSESKFGVLSGNVIWFELLDRLGIDAEKTILESFEIGNLKDNIYGIELVDLYKDPSDNRLLLSFKINDSQCHSTCDNEKDFDADVELEAEAFAKIYAKLNAIQEKALEADVIFACGPTPMLRALKEYAAANNITCWISMEERMACGIGACLACVCKSKDIDDHSKVHNKRVCKEGPVFNIKKLLWQI